MAQTHSLTHGLIHAHTHAYPALGGIYINNTAMHAERLCVHGEGEGGGDSAQEIPFGRPLFSRTCFLYETFVPVPSFGFQRRAHLKNARRRKAHGRNGEGGGNLTGPPADAEKIVTPFHSHAKAR